MNQVSLINQVQNRIHNKTETIADSIVLLRPDLFASTTMNVVLVPTHNIYDFEHLFAIVESLLSLVHMYPHTKIICAVPSHNYHYGILSRFTHISGVIKIDRLIHLCNLIDAFGITHICHTPTLIQTSPIMEFQPTMKVEYQDLLYSHSIMSHKTRTLLSITYQDRIGQDMQVIVDTVKKIKIPYVIMSNIHIHQLDGPHITHNGYITSDVFNPDIDATIALATGLLRSYSLVSITPGYNNIFDLMHRYIH